MQNHGIVGIRLICRGCVGLIGRDNRRNHPQSVFGESESVARLISLFFAEAKRRMDEATMHLSKAFRLILEPWIKQTGGETLDHDAARYYANTEREQAAEIARSAVKPTKGRGRRSRSPKGRSGKAGGSSPPASE